MPHANEKKLLQMKEDILIRLKNISNDKNKVDGPISADFADQAIEMENNEVVDKLDEFERQEILRIDAALIRMKNGTYGKCAECDATIEAKRLEAMPYAIKCLNCAK